MIRVAGVQFDVQLGRVDENGRRMCADLATAAREGAQLVVFPECALTGYCFESAAEARPFAEPIPGPATERFVQACAACHCHVVIGMLEREGDQLFNAAVLIGPAGVIGSYRKIHLPFLGVDRYTNHGDRSFAVHSTGELRVGMNICYDASFPEAARSLMLLGADLIALPTNWPPGAECAAECLIRARAMENGLYFCAVNRVGTERGVRFIGRSQVADPSGHHLHLASEDREEMFFADIDITRSRRKHVIRIPGQHEIDRLADRRPHFYDRLVEPHQLSSPGRGGPATR